MSLDKLFNPESVAIMGASPNFTSLGKLPYYQMLKFGGYKGRLYPINPKYPDLAGKKMYASIDELPEAVDLLIAQIPAKLALETVIAARRKGVKYIHFFTSGFSEAGNRELESKILAEKGDMRILGPNCIGVHCTESRVVFDPFFRQEIKGTAAFAGQSGGITSNFIWMCQSRNIPINKTVSYGNQIDITIEDVLEYFGGDDQIKAIGIYIEDMRNGRRFVKVLREAAGKKPVVVLKGGSTEIGAKAAASHTGAMAGNHVIWASAIRQCGAMEAETFEQMVDVVMLGTSYKVAKGKRLGFLAAGGGTTVLFTDLAGKNGFSMPVLDRSTQEAIATKIKSVNTFTGNPVDLGAFGIDINIMAHSMEAMDVDPNIDIIIPYFSIDFISSFQGDKTETGPRTIIETAKRMKKPVIPVLSKFTENDIGKEETRIKTMNIYREAGLPVFNNIQDCIHALKRMNEWNPRG